MNERIKLLADQAGWTIVMGTRQPIDQRDYVVSPDQAEKFAELIVKECAAVYRDNVKSDRPLYPTEFSAELQKHFGVE